MLRQLTLEKGIEFIWLSVALTVCWPPPPSANKTRVFVFKFLQICSIISAFMLLLPLLYSAYLHMDDVIVASKCVCLSTGVAHIIVQTAMCFAMYDRLQRIIQEMINYIKVAQEFERKIFQKYVEKCNKVYAGSITWIYVCGVAFAMGPTVLPDPFPTDAEYPFSVNYTPVHIMVYAHQTFVGFQCAGHMCLSMFGALLLWFATARLECLSLEVQESSSIPVLIACVKKQLYLKRYAEDVAAAFRYIVVNAVCTSTFALTLCGITVAMNAPFVVKIQFVAVCFTVLVEIYMYTWPADYMKDMSVSVARNSYNMKWYNHTLEMQRNVLYMMVHQDPVTISVSCIMPELTLRYYCSYLSNAFSIFTALRVVLDDASE